MPGLPSQTNQQPPQDDGFDNIRELLSHYLTEKLHQPIPELPLRPGPQPVSQLGALAAARNPQFAPSIMERANAPAQAAFERAMGQHEEALAGRSAALQAGSNLVGRQFELERMMAMMNRPQYHENTVLGPGNAPQIQGFTTRGGQEVQGSRHPIAQKFVPPSIEPTPSGGLARVSKTGAPTSDIPGVGKELDLTATQHLQALDAASHDLNEMESLLDEASKKHGGLERTIAGGAATMPGLHTLTGYADPLAAKHEAIREKMVTELNPIITSQNRIIAGIVEQFLKYVPAYGTNPVVYKQLLANARGSIARATQMIQATRPREAAAIQDAATEETPEQKKARILRKYGVQ